MATETPDVDYFDETTWPVVEIDVFKCCSEADGTYLGDVMTHNPAEPGDGPWFLVVDKDSVKITFGFGTKKEALASMRGLTHYVGYRYEYDVSELED